MLSSLRPPTRPGGLFIALLCAVVALGVGPGVVGATSGTRDSERRAEVDAERALAQEADAAAEKADARARRERRQRQEDRAENRAENWTENGAEVGVQQAPGAAAAGARDAVEGAAQQVLGATGQPNIVVVVMDDVSMDLIGSMRQLARLEQRGATYENSFVVNSLCCPSRAAMFTGQPPHLNGVLTNTSGGPLGAQGGYDAFAENQGPRRSYNTSLRKAGYRTAFLGKYLNEYEPGNPDGIPGGPRTAPPPVPGWSRFEQISGEGYDGWNFWRTTPGPPGPELGIRQYPAPPVDATRAVRDRSYVGTVIGNRAVAMARRYEKSDQPYLLHVAPYAAHARINEIYPLEPIFPPAMRDRPGPGSPHGNCGARRCERLSARDLVGYGDDRDDNAPTYLRGGRTSPAPAWRTDLVTLTRDQAVTRYRDRTRMVQSVDRMLGRLRKVIGPDTYLVVTSDNGFHLGQHGLNGGKGLPYDSDTRVPLVVVGPGVEPGARDQLVSSLDLASTFEQLAGRPVADFRTGNSLLPTLGDPQAAGARFTYFEHRQGPVLAGEPDADAGSGGRLDSIPSYVAVRSERGLLVRVDLERDWALQDYAWELYRYDKPYEDRNVFAADHDKPWARDLRRRLLAWEGCEPQACRRLTR